MKSTLGDVYLQTDLKESFENTFHVYFVLGFIITVNQDIVKIRGAKVVKELAEGIINIVLKRNEFIAKIEGHD